MTRRAILHPTIRDAVTWKEVHEQEPGLTPPGRIPVIRQDGSRAGHVGHSSGAAVAERILGRAGVKLGEHEGKPAWLERPRRSVPARTASVSAVDQIASLKTAKGSVGDGHKPRTHVRPHR